MPVWGHVSVDFDLPPKIVDPKNTLFVIYPHFAPLFANYPVYFVPASSPFYWHTMYHVFFYTYFNFQLTATECPNTLERI